MLTALIWRNCLLPILHPTVVIFNPLNFLSIVEGVFALCNLSFL